ncbi:MAG TPA: sigma-70 family RNA polymerase sigma factor [Phycisphaerae bacterium]|nr:sigma-70 family RNA polymerase sigma factor [Phycisphaerae bacterium]
MNATDEELVNRARDGNSDAFAELVRRYRDAAYGTALSVLCEPGEAAEVTQDALFRAYRCLHQLRDPGRFAGWICRIAKNLARNRLSRRRPVAGSTSLGAVEDLPATGLSSEEAAGQSEDLAAIGRLLQAMPDEQRLTFTLFHIDGYSEADLSDMLGVAVGTVKSRLSRARSRLRREVVAMARKFMNEQKPDAEFWRRATGTVTGRVTSAATGAPVEGAKVHLSAGEDGSHTEVESGPDGVWQAGQLVPGMYQITVRHPNFVPRRYREETVHIDPSVTVRPGQRVQGIDVQLEPGACIRGIALAADGSPVPDAEVSALRWMDPYGKGPCFHRSARARSDKDGRFALRLPAAVHVVGIQPSPLQPMCYCPGTYSLHDADRVERSPEKPDQGLVIRLPKSGTHDLNVRVTDSETGNPIVGARVLVNRRDAFMWDQFEGRTDEQGWFRTPSLTSGPFQITVGAEEKGYPRWSQWIDVERDQKGVEVGFRLPRGAAFEGRLVTEDGSEPAPVEEVSCVFTPIPPDELDGRPRRHTDCAVVRCDATTWRYLGMYEGPQAESVRADGGVIVSPPVTPGDVKIGTSTRDKEWRVIRVSIAGRALLAGETFHCKPGERTQDLEIVLGANLGVVAGRVVSAARNKPLEGVWVRLWREDKQPFGPVPLPTDRSGSFFFHSVPAGPYVIGVTRSHGEQAPIDEESKRDLVVEADGVVHLDLVLRSS